MAGEPSKDAEKKEDETRRRAREAERIETLRNRLYSRGTEGGELAVERHRLERAEAPESALDTPLPPEPTPPPLYTPPPIQPMTRSSRGKFRTVVMLLGLIFFVGALVVSGIFLYLGNNTISGANITIDVQGPLKVTAGEEVNVAIAIMNENTLPIESATLIINYPRGAQSVTEEGKELFSERQQLNNIDSGEVVKVPVRMLMYGEENDTKQMKVAVEYRVQGSNATFSKEAAPYEFTINTSPVTITIDAVKSLPSGQEATVDLTVRSNATENLTGLILKAAYPPDFEYTKSTKETASGEDTWRIKTLKPGEEEKISITGVLTGSEGQEHDFEFQVGVPSERDAFNIVSILSKGEHTMRIERPFLDVDVLVNGKNTETVIVDQKDSARITIKFTNALENAVYDGVISATLSGNALDEIAITSDDGYYDSLKNTITWDSVDVESLREVAPGDTNTVSFTFAPREDIEKTPEVKLAVSIQANRVLEDRVPEKIAGTVERIIKIASVTKLTSAAIYSDGPFVNSGPTPPIAEKTTQYSYLIAVKNGTNPVSNAEVSAVVPQYITWLDMVSDDDAVTYNAQSRTLRWNIGDMPANGYREVWVQVAFTPSLSQVGRIQTLLESQRFKATDKFTGTTVRAEAPALTSKLEKDPDPRRRDGEVQKP